MRHSQSQLPLRTVWQISHLARSVYSTPIPSSSSGLISYQLKAASSGISDTGCATTDYHCLCSASSFLAALQGQIVTVCSASDIQSMTSSQKISHVYSHNPMSPKQWLPRLTSIQKPSSLPKASAPPSASPSPSPAPPPNPAPPPPPPPLSTTTHPPLPQHQTPA